MDFVTDLPEDVLSRVLLHCAAQDALRVSSACRTVLSAVSVNAQRLFVVIFGSTHVPECLLSSRPKFLGRLDRARSCELQNVHDTFAWAATFGYPTFLQRTCEAWSGDVAVMLDHRVDDGTAPLTLAARSRQGDVVALLLQLKADVEAAGKDGRTPLYWSSRHGCVSTVQRLLDCNASPLKTSRKGDCPLSAMVNVSGGLTPGREEAMQLMASVLDAEQRISSPAQKALLAACEAGGLRYAEILINNGIFSVPPVGGPPVTLAPMPAQQAPAVYQPRHDVPDAPPSGRAAAPSVMADVGGLMISGGAVAMTLTPAAPRARQRSQSAQGRRIQPPRNSAAAAVAPQSIARNSDAGVHPLDLAPSGTPTQETTPLLEATSRGFPEVVELLLDNDVNARSGVNVTLPSGKTALHLAAEKNDSRSCNKILAAGASLDQLTCGGRSALYTAVEHAHVATVKAICAFAETRHLKQQTPNGVSSVSLAEKRGKPALILPLLQCYQRNVKKKEAARKSIADEVADKHLTSLCLKYQDYLLQAETEEESLEDLPPPLPRPRPPPAPSTAPAVVPPLEAAPEPEADRGRASSAQRNGGNSRASTPGRYTRVMEQNRRSDDGSIIGRGNLRRQLGLPSNDAHEEVESTRRSWGVSAPRTRPTSASAKKSTRVVPRCTSGEMWNAAAQNGDTNEDQAVDLVEALATSPEPLSPPMAEPLPPEQLPHEPEPLEPCLSEAPVEQWAPYPPPLPGESAAPAPPEERPPHAPPLEQWADPAPLEQSTHQQMPIVLHHAAEAAMAADDAMEQLLADFFSDEEGLDAG